jgi:hypothetical protein
MMIGSEYLGFALRMITVVVPVAVYFLILGLLNSRRHPQLLSGRQDFALLIVAMSPVFALPALLFIGPSAWTVLVGAVLMAVAIVVLWPSDRMWVIYNMPAEEARRAVSGCLASMGLEYAVRRNDFVLDGGQASLRISEFPLLRNVTIRLRGGSGQLARRFHEGMSARLASAPAQTSPSAVMLLLVATAMLVAPVTMFVQHAPQIVRLITDLIH